MTAHCPDCGAGPNPDGTFTMSRGFPVEPPCPTCELFFYDAMYEVGGRVRTERNRLASKLPHVPALSSS